MADKTPIKAVFNASDVATGLAEFETSDTVALTDGGTGASLSIGSAGQVLKVNSGGTAVEFGSMTATGALDSGSITSGFGAIDNGTSNITSGGLLKIDVDADADDLTGDSSTGRLTLGAGEDLNLYHGGTNSYIVNDTGDLIIDTAGDMTLDADGGDVVLKDGGTQFGSLTNSSGDLIVKSGSTTMLTGDGANVTVAGNAVIGGNLTVSGTTTTVSTTNTVVSDKLLELANGQSGTPSGDIGIVGERGSSNNIFFGFDESADEFVVGTGTFTGTTTGNLTITQGTFSAANLKISSDSGALSFGVDSDITLTHEADVGLKLKHTATGDDKPIVLTLQTGETDMAANDVMGAIRFQAPDEGTGTDAILVAAGIQAVAEGDFSSSNNATTLEFHTGASEAAAKKMALSSTGVLTLSGSSGAVVIPNDGTIGSASDTDAIAIDSSGDVTFSSTSASSNVTSGALQVAGGVGVAADLYVGDDLSLNSDGGILKFGNNEEVTVTHVHDTGLLLNSTNQLQFGDSGTYIHQSADGVLDLVSDTEIEINATTIDINGAVDVSGNLSVGGNLDVTGTIDFSDSNITNAGSLGLDKIFGDDDSNTDITFSGSDVITITTGGTSAATFDASQNFDVTGDITGATLNADGDTSAGDNAAIGYTSAEGLILTGQGSTNDVTIKNDVDTAVMQIPTGGTAVTFAGNVTVGGDLDVTGSFDLSDQDFTNVGSIQLDSISGDGDTNTSITFSGSDVITIATGGTTAATFDANQILTLADDLKIKDGGTIGNASVADVLTLASTGIVTFKDDILIKDGGTIGAASDADSITIASDGVVTFSQKDVHDAGLSVKNGSTSAGFVEFFEDSDNGTNKVTLIGPASTGDVTLTLPSHESGTLKIDSASIILNSTDGSSNAGDNIVQNTAANENANILLEDGMHDPVGLLASHGITLSGQSINLPTITGSTTFDSSVSVSSLTTTGNLTVGGDLDVTGSFDMSDANITNVGSIALDSISGDGDSNSSITFSGSDVITFATGGSTAATFNSSQAFTASGRILVDDATDATSTTDGSLQTDGGLSVVKDAVFGDDVLLLSDSAVLKFGADSDTTLTHTDGSGLTLNSTNKIMFGDTGTYIHQSADGVLDLVSDTELELNATTIDINGAVEISGATTQTGISTSAAKDVFNAGMSVKNGSTSAGFIEFFEDSDNGSNKATLIGPASTGDITLTLPASAGTIATTDDATALAIALG